MYFWADANLGVGHLHQFQKWKNAQSDDNTLKNILKTEVSYRRRISPQDCQARPNLYRLNQISNTDLKVNLALIPTTLLAKANSLTDESE